MKSVFIDGSAGTTGLRIRERLADRDDIELTILPDPLRKDTDARLDAIASSDITFFCLPDAASKETMEKAADVDTVIIDTSTAFRTSDGWTYGFPELRGQKERIAGSKRIANPGCHASGFIALAAPLVACGVIDKCAHLDGVSLTGYSGGGNKMIAEYENEPGELLGAPRQYGLTQMHKHLPEIVKVCGLSHAPAFMPIVSDYYSGMEVTIPLHGDVIGCGIEEVKDALRSYYSSGIIHYRESDENGFLSASSMSGFDDMEVSVYGNDERMILVSRFDNLGKGASGSAIQNMNIIMGTDETKGLNLKGSE